MSEVESIRVVPSPSRLIQRALMHVSKMPVQYELVPDPAVQTTSAGYRIVHLHQYHRGIPVLGGGCSLLFSPRGTWLKYEGECLALSLSTSSIPVVGATTAVRAATMHLASSGIPTHQLMRRAPRFRPRILASFPQPSRPTILNKGPFADLITAYLLFYPDGSRARLAWCLTFTLPGDGGEYEIIVRADSKKPKVLDCGSILKCVRAQGKVFDPFPKPPARRDRLFPPPLSEYPEFLRPLPQGFPFDWVDKNEVRGNCTEAVLANTTKSFRGTIVNTLLAFDPALEGGDEQKLVNAFFYCNFMHNFFFGLGFDEAAGNFQNVNRTGAGRGDDHVIARIFNVALNGHATMRGRPDGKNGEMRLGVMPGSSRHTALDPDVVMHEFTHGVTERLVGGPMNWRALEKPQSVALGEGWSDYFALTIQNYGRAPEEQKVVFGDWVGNLPAGLRHSPYDDNFPKGFGDVGSAPYNRAPECGEIWCAALMRMNRAIGAALGDLRRGHEIGWQVVVDGLMLVHPNPNFIQARDAILQALDSLLEEDLVSAADHLKINSAIWGAFAATGLGPNARSNGTSLSGNVAG